MPPSARRLRRPATTSPPITAATTTPPRPSRRKPRSRSSNGTLATTSPAEQGIVNVENEVGPIEVLVNNAGISRDAMLQKMTHEQWEQVIRTNLDSLFNMTRPVINGMRERGFGRIINISSINGQKGQLGLANYCAAKVRRDRLHPRAGARKRAQGHNRERDRARLRRDRAARRRVRGGDEVDRRPDPGRPSWAKPTRSRAAWCSSPPTRPPGSPARRSPSTAASSWIERTAPVIDSQSGQGSKPSRSELEAGRDRAAEQRPGTEAARGLPRVCRHQPRAGARLRAGWIRAGIRAASRRPDLEQQRHPAVPVPELGGIDPMPARHLAGLQQKQDRGRMRAALVALRSRNVSRNQPPSGWGLSPRCAITSSAVSDSRHLQAYLVMAGLVSAIHECSLDSARRRGCPAQGRA